MDMIMQLSSNRAGFLAWLAGQFGHVAKLAVLEALRKPDDQILDQMTKFWEISDRRFIILGVEEAKDLADLIASACTWPLCCFWQQWVDVPLLKSCLGLSA